MTATIKEIKQSDEQIYYMRVVKPLLLALGWLPAGARSLNKACERKLQRAAEPENLELEDEELLFSNENCPRQTNAVTEANIEPLFAIHTFDDDEDPQSERNLAYHNSLRTKIQQAALKIDANNSVREPYYKAMKELLENAIQKAPIEATKICINAKTLKAARPKIALTPQNYLPYLKEAIKEAPKGKGPQYYFNIVKPLLMGLGWFPQDTKELNAACKVVTQPTR